MKKILVNVAMFAIVFSFLCAQATAAVIWREGAVPVEAEMAEQGGRIHIGKLKIIPSVAVQGVYDSNIFLGNDFTKNQVNPQGIVLKPLKSDYILHTMPGVLFDFSLPDRGSVKLAYEGDWAFYRYTTSNNWDNQRGLFSVDYQAPAGLILGISNIYSKGNDPYGDASQYGLGLTKKRWNNDFTGKIGWDFFNRFKALVYYNYYKQKYKDARDYTQNWADNEFGLGFEMKVLPKTWAFVRYHYGTQDFYDHRGNTTGNNNASNKWNRGNIGLAWDGGGKIGGELNFGYEWLKFDNNIDPQADKYHDKNTWIAATSIDYAPTATTTLTLNIARAVRPTGADKQEYYEDTQIGINLNQDLPYKFSTTVGFTYGRNAYNTKAIFLNEDRTDNNFNGNVNMKYIIQSWLSADAGYRYMRKDSNSIDQEFTDHQVMLMLRASY